MAKPNSFIQRLQREADARQRASHAFARQYALDMHLITLHNCYGWGKERCLEYIKNVEGTYKDAADITLDDFKGDKKVEYAKAVIDRELAFLGEDYPKWEERYG